jgi:hypothetical protein
MKHLLPLLGLLCALPAAALAQTNLATPEGSWAGKLQLPGVSLRIVLHVKAAAAGAYTATLDCPDQGANGIIPFAHELRRSDLFADNI